MTKKITEQREDELMADFALKVLERIDNGEEKLYPASVLLEMANKDYENITLANEAEQVFSRIETGEEKTISSKEFFENAKQRGFDI